MSRRTRTFIAVALALGVTCWIEITAMPTAHTLASRAILAALGLFEGVACGGMMEDVAQEERKRADAARGGVRTDG